MPDKCNFSRRSFIKSAAAGGVLASVQGRAPWVWSKTRPQADLNQLPDQPNVLVLLSDQQRSPRHWPAGWVEQNLPNYTYLQNHGMTFTRAYCNSAMCSPSRATLFTGVYPAQHGVVDTLTETTSFVEQDLPRDLPNVASMLASAGYHVEYHGKWHLTKNPDGATETTPEDLMAYGFEGWVPPDAGQDTAPENFGYYHDERYATEASDFLSMWAQSGGGKPFALFLSLVNPHDVLAYPGGYEPEFAEWNDRIDLGIPLPPTINEDLSTKPDIHQAQLMGMNLRLGPLITPQQRHNYVNFYAQLQIDIDLLFDRVIQSLQANGFLENTLVIRISDHGEMGLSHNGLRHKAFNMYEETINIPLIVSNPVLFPQATPSDSLSSLIDLMPTLATLCKADISRGYDIRGRDLTPILQDPTASVQDEILFTYDDERAGNPDPNPNFALPQQNHLKAIIQKDWKFARYFDPASEAGGAGEADQYEMYNLGSDPNEINNRAWEPENDDAAQMQSLHAQFNEIVAERLSPLQTPSAVKTWSHLK